MNDRLSGVSFRGLIRVLVDPDTAEQDRWLTRLALLQLADVEPTTEALAFLAGSTPERAMGAMAVLQTEGKVSFTETDS